MSHVACSEVEQAELGPDPARIRRSGEIVKAVMEIPRAVRYV
jgi:hypothetical protein